MWLSWVVILVPQIIPLFFIDVQFSYLLFPCAIYHEGTVLRISNCAGKCENLHWESIFTGTSAYDTYFSCWS